MMALRLIRFAFGSALFLGLMAGGASASYMSTDKVVRTKLPYWRVGILDKKLSRACSLGNFNQRVPFKYSGQFWGPKGSTLLGAAKGDGLNLFDSKGYASKDYDYWFYRDRTSDCIVFKAKVKTPPPTPVNATGFNANAAKIVADGKAAATK